MTWYRIHDLPEPQDVIGDANNRHLGILDQQSHAKPALRALQFFENRFAGKAYRCIDNKVVLTKPIGAPAELHAFERADGTILMIGWLKTYVPGTRADATGIVPDARTAQVSVQTPVEQTRSGPLLEELGRSKGETQLLDTKEGQQMADFQLRDSEITVLEIHPHPNQKRKHEGRQGRTRDPHCLPNE